MNQTVTYLQELTAIPSPTGFTREIADYLVKTIEGFGYEVTRTAKGGVNVTIPGVITDKQRYVTAHVDTCESRWPPQAGPYRWFPLEYD